MQWEHLTSLDFEKAVQECQGVGILPVGVIEAHSSHLPLGMDMFACHYAACRAAEIEPAIVFHALPLWCQYRIGTFARCGRYSAAR